MLLTTLRSISTIARIKRKQCILAIGLCYYRSEPVDGSMSVPVNSEVCLVARWGAVFFLAGGRGGKLHWLRWMSGKDVVFGLFLVIFVYWYSYAKTIPELVPFRWFISFVTGQNQDESIVVMFEDFFQITPWVVPFSPAWHLPCWN